MVQLRPKRGYGMDVKLVLFKKNGSQKTFPLPSEVTVIGRRQDCDLCIPLMLVSRRHCEVDKEMDAIKLRDLGSRNGTFLNGTRVDETEINPGDYIQIGPVTFAFQIDGKPENINTPDPSMIKPPLSIQSVDSNGTFAGPGELDSSQGQHATELLDSLDDN